MNDSMSLGVHRLWKDSFVTSVLPRLPPTFHNHPESLASTSRAPNPKFKCLDVAGGTGDIALRILDRAREKFGSRDVEVEIVDLNMGMLDEGRKRVAKTLYYNSELTNDWQFSTEISADHCQLLKSLSHMVMPNHSQLISPTTLSISILSLLGSGIARHYPQS